MQQHIKKVICSNIEAHYEVVLDWLSQTLQNPGGEKPGVALVMRGGKGVGKGIFATNFGKIFGQHFLHLTYSGHFTGRFNYHLKDKILVFVDEAIWTGDKSAEGLIKGYVTESTMQIESKGVNAVDLRNHMRFIIASNNDYIVPSSHDERRFFVVDVSPHLRGNYEYFKSLAYQMGNGGREAMLYDLLQREHSMSNIRNFPRTEALLDQMMYSASTVEKFWYSLLTTGEMEAEIIRDEFYKQYCKFASQIRDRHPDIREVFGKKLKEMCQDIRDARPTINNKRERVYQIPSLEVCRRLFEERVGMKIKWDQ